MPLDQRCILVETLVTTVVAIGGAEKDGNGIGMVPKNGSLVTDAVVNMAGDAFALF